MGDRSGCAVGRLWLRSDERTKSQFPCDRCYLQLSSRSRPTGCGRSTTERATFTTSNSSTAFVLHRSTRILAVCCDSVAASCVQEDRDKPRMLVEPSSSPSLLHTSYRRMHREQFCLCVPDTSYFPPCAWLANISRACPGVASPPYTEVRSRLGRGLHPTRTWVRVGCVFFANSSWVRGS